MYITPQFMADELLLYLRKSRTDDPVLSVEEVLAKHEQLLDEWVERNQPGVGTIPEKNRYREVVSGETIDSRPRMVDLLRAIESPRVKAILCVEPQRLSRGDLQDIGYLVKILRYTNTLVITLNYTYDMNDDRDREHFERELQRGNEFLEYQKRIMSRGRQLAAENGNFIGSVAPYGYKKIKIKEGKQTAHTLEPIPEQAEVVKRIFEMYKSGMGRVRIATQLTEECVPSPGGQRRWIDSTITKILTNPHYIGKVVWFNQQNVRIVEEGQIISSRRKTNNALVVDGKHPPIIDQELWDEVQEVRGKQTREPASTKLKNALAGLMFCKECGAATAAKWFWTKNGEQYSAPVFMCSVRKDCSCGSGPQSQVYDEVARVLEAAVEEFQVQVEAGTDNSLEQHKQRIARLEKRLTALRETEVKQWEEKMEHNMPAHVFKRLNDATIAEIEEVNQALHDARAATPEEVDLEARIVTFKAALDALRDPDAPVKKKNQLLKACIERIEYYRPRKATQGGRDPECHRPITLDITLRV